MGRKSFHFQLEALTHGLLILFSITSCFVQAQNKSLIINDSLSNAESFDVRNVKLKTFKFDEYTVVKAKVPWITNTAHKTYKTHEENIDHQKFSFTLVNKKSDVAEVEAMFTKTSQYRQSGGFLFEALTGVETTNYEDLNNTSNLSASIIINNNKTGPWNLVLEETPNIHGENRIKGRLGNGMRFIDIVQVYFDKEGTYVIDDTLSYPPIRYEFVENGQSIGAFRREYNLNSNFLFNTNLESTLKMILAASMISILQTEYCYRFQVKRE